MSGLTRDHSVATARPVLVGTASKCEWPTGSSRVPRPCESKGCGEVKSKLNLAERRYACAICGLVIDRDLNAAINLARWHPKEALLGVPTRELLLSTA